MQFLSALCQSLCSSAMEPPQNRQSLLQAHSPSLKAWGVHPNLFKLFSNALTPRRGMLLGISSQSVWGFLGHQVQELPSSMMPLTSLYVLVLPQVALRFFTKLPEPPLLSLTRIGLSPFAAWLNNFTKDSSMPRQDDDNREKEIMKQAIREWMDDAF